MTTIKSGDKVQMHYKGTLSDGTVFDSSEGREPLAFEQGAGQIIPGLDGALAGMALGDKKRVEVPADQAYGPHHAEGIQKVDRSLFPDDMELTPGLQLQMQAQNGQAMPVVVTEVAEAEVTLDANHPLAGKDLIFDVEIVAIG